MKEEFNYCPIPEYAKQLAAYPGQLPGWLKDNGLDGAELYVYDTKPYEEDYRDTAVGVHLRYWPSWLDFWFGKKEEAAREHKDAEALRAYFGGAATPDKWLGVIEANIRASLAAEPEYLVWHVSQCRREESFTFRFAYDDETVLDAAAEVFNAVSAAVPEGVPVLFENLWWPGLRLTQPRLAERFFEKIERENVGIMLDTGHLLNTEPALTTEEEGAAYLCRRVKDLGYLKELIKGLHLSCSLSGAYRRQLPSLVQSSSSEEDLMAHLMSHIVRLDQHRPFSSPAVAELIELVQPRYLVHELYYDTFAELAKYLRQQRALLP